ncbi:histidine kinase N-terminal 7TM domain-containing protein [Tundrisphaera lichenicola]|uniref:histidine kinase N-terminal 7TM domain-containing protein n=1 Tax=Tundrisphaera lichenicola TaxID=2029860 RepID=UPI003EBC7970
MLSWQHHPDARYFFVASGVSALLSIFAWRRGRVPTSTAFAWMMLGQTAWSLGSGLELSFSDLPTKILCLDLMNIGVTITIPGLLIFMLRFAQLDHLISRRNVFYLLVFPLATLVIAWTNPWHHLYYRSIRLIEYHGAVTGLEVRGPWFWAHAAYLYFWLVVVTFLLIRVASRSAGLYRGQATLLLLGISLPWVANAADLAGVSPFPRLDLTSMIFSVSGLLLVPALLRFRLLDLVPVARDVVIQGMLDPVIVLDPTGLIGDLNRAARDLLDLPDKEYFAERARTVFRPWPGLAEQTEHLAERSVEIEGPDPAVVKVFDLRISRLVPEGRMAGWVLVLREITERKLAEQERVRRVGAEAARAVAEASIRAKDKFLAILSHELRTPLTPVLAAVSAMLDDDQVPELRPTLAMILRNIELEARLIDDLLDVTRIGRGTFRLDPVPLDAHEVTRQAIEICLGDIEDGRIALTTELTALDHHVEADPSRLQQILWNLLKNAVKFTPEGGSIAIRSRNLAPPDPDSRPSLAIEVTDTGAGIGAASLERIFEAFEQGEVVSRQRTGLGLGLAIGRSLAEAHGGRLTAESPGLGQGSTFVLELRTIARPTPAARVPTGSAEPPVLPIARTLRILLVEDNKDTLNYLRIVLESRGHELTTAQRLTEALQAASSRDFDLILSDIELPDGSGLELIRQSRWRGIPSIAFSGYGSEDDAQASLAAGFTEHLTKPVTWAKLEAAIRRVTTYCRPTIRD